jgi:hypothetical protein
MKIFLKLDGVARKAARGEEMSGRRGSNALTKWAIGSPSLDFKGLASSSN